MRNSIVIFLLSLLSVFGQAPPYQRQFFSTNTDPVVQVTAGSNTWITYTTTEPGGQVRSFLVDTLGSTDRWWTNPAGQLHLSTNSPEVAVGSISNNYNVGIKGLLSLYGTNAVNQNATNGPAPFIEFRVSGPHDRNTYVGRHAGLSNRTGIANTFIGGQAGASNISGSYNTYVGARAGRNGITAPHNVAVGFDALRDHYGTIGENVAVGSQALMANGNFSDNVAIGYNALASVTNASSNIAIGTTVMPVLYSGSGNNVCIGQGIGNDWQKESYNTVVGVGAMANTLGASGSNNSVFGYNAGVGIKGTSNTCAGVLSLSDLTWGFWNTALGVYAGRGINSGSNNLILGDYIGVVDGTTFQPRSNIIIGVGGRYKAHYDGTNDWKFDPSLSTPLYMRATNGMSIGYPVMTPFTNWVNTNSFESTRMPATNITFRFLVPTNVVTVVYTNMGWPYSNVFDNTQIRSNPAITEFYITNYGTYGDALINVPFYTASSSTNAPAWNEFITKDYVDRNVIGGAATNAIGNLNGIGTNVTIFGNPYITNYMQFNQNGLAITNDTGDSVTINNVDMFMTNSHTAGGPTYLRLSANATNGSPGVGTDVIDYHYGGAPKFQVYATNGSLQSAGGAYFVQAIGTSSNILATNNIYAYGGFVGDGSDVTGLQVAHLDTNGNPANYLSGVGTWTTPPGGSMDYGVTNTLLASYNFWTGPTNYFTNSVIVEHTNPSSVKIMSGGTNVLTITNGRIAIATDHAWTEMQVGRDSGVTNPPQLFIGGFSDSDMGRPTLLFNGPGPLYMGMGSGIGTNYGYDNLWVGSSGIADDWRPDAQATNFVFTVRGDLQSIGSVTATNYLQWVTMPTNTAQYALGTALTNGVWVLTTNGVPGGTAGALTNFETRFITFTNNFTVVTGYVGIGTTNPTYPLHIEQEFSDVPGTNTFIGFVYSGTHTPYAALRMDNNGSFCVDTFTGSWDKALIIRQSNRSVGIGADYPFSLLHVSNSVQDRIALRVETFGSAITTNLFQVFSNEVSVFNISSNGTVYGNGSGLTNLNASSLASGTVPTITLTNATLNVDRLVPVQMPLWVVFEGDSLTAGSGGLDSYATLVTNLDVRFIQSTNLAVGGETIVQMDAAYATNAATFAPSGGTNAIFSLWAGATTFGQTVAQFAGYWSNLVSNARADGFKIVAFTILPTTNYPAGDAFDFVRMAKNDYIRYSGLWDWLIDVAAMFPDPHNSTYFNVDGVHLTASAQTNVANVWLNAMRQSPQMPYNSAAEFSVKSNATFSVVNEIGTALLTASGNGGVVGIGRYATNGGANTGKLVVNSSDYAKTVVTVWNDAANIVSNLVNGVSNTTPVFAITPNGSYQAIGSGSRAEVQPTQLTLTNGSNFIIVTNKFLGIQKPYNASYSLMTDQAISSGTALYAGTFVEVQPDYFFSVSAKSRIASAVDGRWNLRNNGNTGFDTLIFGPDGASWTSTNWPALRVSESTNTVSLTLQRGTNNSASSGVANLRVTGSVTATNTVTATNFALLTPQWADVPVLYAFSVVGPSAPVLVATRPGGIIKELAFDHDAILYGQGQFPHNVATTNANFPNFYFEPHVHFSVTNLPAGQTNVVWQAEWEIASINGTYSLGTNAVTNVVSAVYTHYLAELGHITNNSPPGISSVFRCRLTRPNSGDGDYGNTSDVLLDGMDIHVPVGNVVGIGSRNDNSQ